MRRLSIFLATALLVLQSVAWAHDEEMQAELLDEVLRLTQAEIPDDIILEQIRAWEFAFELSADDIVELRTLGVSDVVLEALIATSPFVEVDTHSNVVLTAGYYAPWYWFPVAWGGYWDPFSNLYCAYYYPFHYGYAGFGYYGWCGSTYYAHYSPGHWHLQVTNLRYSRVQLCATTLSLAACPPAVREYCGPSIPRLPHEVGCAAAPVLRSVRAFLSYVFQ